MSDDAVMWLLIGLIAVVSWFAFPELSPMLR